MGAYRLDPVDEAIIAVLQDDGRASLTRIGAAVGLSADAVRGRVTRLTSDGIVRVIGVVDPASLGLSCIATVALDVRGDVRKFADRMRHFRDVTFLAVTLGEFSLLAELATSDDGALVDFVYGTLAELEGFRRAELWKHLSGVAWDTGAAKPAEAGPTGTQCRLDETDARLLRALAQNPRAKYSELSALAGVPYSVARRRSQALFESGVIDAATVVSGGSMEADPLALLGIEVVGDLRRVSVGLAVITGVESVVRTSGRFDLVVEVAARTPESVATLVDDDVRDIEGVHRVVIYPFARVEVVPFPWRFRRRLQSSSRHGS